MEYEFQKTDSGLISALTQFSNSPFELIDYLKKDRLLLGVVLSGEGRQFLLSENSDYQALAVFSREDTLRNFNSGARPVIFTGKEMADFTLKSGSGLLEIDPPAGVILTGSMTRAIANGSCWADPLKNSDLMMSIEDFLHSNGQDHFQIKRGIWTDLQIYLSGDLAKAIAVASLLGDFLSKSQTALENLPSGADILFSES